MLDKLKHVAFLLAVGALIYIITIAVPVADNVNITAVDGTADLTTYDMAQNIAQISGWESYPNKLYTPQDFAGNKTDIPVTFNDTLEQTAKTGTHRLRLKLPAGETYGITFRSLDFATKVYIDGREVGGAGVVGETAQTSTPRNNRLYYFITPQSNEVEIILQYANFVHKEGGRPTTFSVSSAANIMRMTKKDIFSNTLLAGILFSAFLYHIGIFILQRKRREFLYFALMCLLFALRADLIAAMFFPLYNWTIAIKAEYIIIFGAAISVALLFQRLYPSNTNKNVLRTVAGLLGAYILLIIVTPPIFSASLIPFVQVLCAAALCYVLIRLVCMVIKSTRIQDMLAFFGMLLFTLTAVNDILALNNLPHLGNNLMPTGMVIFILSYMIILSTETAQKEREMLLARVQAENQLALQTRRYETIVADIERTQQARHDLRHHLSVVSAYVEKGDNATLKRYLTDYLGGLPETEEPPFCQNHAVDAVVRHYLSRARTAGAELDIHLKLPQHTGIPDADLCVVFGNIFENAAKAIERQKDGRKYIKAICKTDADKLVLTVDNSTSIGEKQRGGVGLGSVETVANKHDGGAKFERGAGVFRSSVMLYKENINNDTKQEELQ